MPLERTRKAREERLYPEGVHVFELPASADALREEQAYQQSGRNGLVLVKNAEVRVILQVLRRGASLAEHRAPGPITVQVLEGEVRFETSGEAVYLRCGEILSLPSGRPHTVEAVEDAAFLITIAPDRAQETE